MAEDDGVALLAQPVDFSLQIEALQTLDGGVHRNVLSKLSVRRRAATPPPRPRHARAHRDQGDGRARSRLRLSPAAGRGPHTWTIPSAECSAGRRRAGAGSAPRAACGGPSSIAPDAAAA